MIANFANTNEPPEIALSREAAVETDPRRRIELNRQLIPMLPPDEPFVAIALRSLSDDLEMTGDYLMAYRTRVEAIAHLDRELTPRREILVEMLVDAMAMAIEAADASDDPALASTLLTEALALADRRDKEPGGPDATAFYRGRALYKQGHAREAIPFLQRGLILAEAAPSPPPGRIAMRSAILARALWDVGEHDRAKQLADTARVMFVKGRDAVAAVPGYVVAMNKRIASFDAWYKAHF